MPDSIISCKTGQCEHWIWVDGTNVQHIDTLVWEPSDSDTVESLRQTLQEAEDEGNYELAAIVDSYLKELVQEYEE